MLLTAGCLDRGHVVLGPGRELVVDRAQELERRGQADISDRRLVAADELLVAQEKLAVDLERLGERGLGVLLRLRLHLVVGVGRPHLSGVLRKAERLIGRARE